MQKSVSCNATYGRRYVGMYTNRVLMKGMCVSHYCALVEACIDGQKFFRYEFLSCRHNRSYTINYIVFNEFVNKLYCMS